MVVLRITSSQVLLSLLVLPVLAVVVVVVVEEAATGAAVVGFVVSGLGWSVVVAVGAGSPVLAIAAVPVELFVVAEFGVLGAAVVFVAAVLACGCCGHPLLQRQLRPRRLPPML